MRFTRAAGRVAVLTAVIGAMSASTGMAAPAHTTRVDVSTAGTLANAATDSSGIAISDGGRFVVFASGATNLVAGDTNGMRDVFVRNTRTGATTRADLGPGGVQANGDSFGPVAISGDGRFVAFESDSSNLVPGSGCSPGQLPFCLFIHDRNLGTNRVIKRLFDPVGSRCRSMAATWSPRRRRLRSSGSTSTTARRRGRPLQPRHRLRASQLRRHFGRREPDLVRAERRPVGAEACDRAGVRPQHRPRDDERRQPDARRHAGEQRQLRRRDLAGRALRDLLVVGVEPRARRDASPRGRVRVRPPRDTIHRIDVGPPEALPTAPVSRSRSPPAAAIACSSSSATNLVAGDTNGAWDIFIRDRHTGKTVRVDLTATGGQANHGIGKIVPGAVAVTAGARWLAFVSPSTNLHPPNANSLIHTYLRGPLY